MANPTASPHSITISALTYTKSRDQIGSVDAERGATLDLSTSATLSINGTVIVHRIQSISQGKIVGVKKTS